MASRFHEIRRVVTNLAVIDFEATDDNGIPAMRLRSVHPGVTVAEVVEASGCELLVPDEVPESPGPTPEQSEQLERLDPNGLRFSEIADQ